MKNPFAVFSYIAYLVVSSIVIYQTGHTFIHALNVIPSLLVLLFYIERKNFNLSNADLLPIFPLALLPLTEILVIFTEYNSNVFAIFTNACYFLVVHVIYLIIYRKEGSRMLSFSPKDYYLIYPIILATFLIFGFLFLSTIPGYLMLVTMLIGSLLSILLAHILNRKVNKISYRLGVFGGVMITITDFLMGYANFIQPSELIYCILRITYFFGLFLLTKSIVVIGDNCFPLTRKQTKKIGYEVEIS